MSVWAKAIRQPLVGRVTGAELAGLVLLGLFLSAIEAFGTGEMPQPLRYTYWQMALVGGGLIAALIEPILARRLAARPVLMFVAQLGVMTALITAWVSVIPIVFFGPHAVAENFLPLLPDVLTVNLAVILVVLVIRRLLAPHHRAVATDGAAPPEIRTKLPPRLARARLIAVEAEDHYLRIHTEAGSYLVLMRFGDALEALAVCDGFQTHRSWWVARTGVETAYWKGGRGELILSDGSAAPVSRTYAAALKGTDWAAPVTVPV